VGRKGKPKHTSSRGEKAGTGFDSATHGIAKDLKEKKEAREKVRYSGAKRKNYRRGGGRGIKNSHVEKGERHHLQGSRRSRNK